MSTGWLASSVAGSLVRRQALLNGTSVILRGLNWLFLIEMVVALIVILFYLFYFSRLFGSFVGALLTRLLLFRSFNVHLEFESIQISPLGGRISFKDLRYVSRNQSLRVQTGHLTLRYWFWRVRDNQPQSGTKELPCRVKVEFEGLEWFVYNRTPSYDAIIEHIVEQADAPLGEKRSKSTARSSKKSSQPEKAPLLTEHAGLNSWWADFLPVQIVCKTGAITLGNRATPTVLIVGFKHARGTYSVTQSRSSCDFYKEMYDFVFEKPKAVWRTNPDYDESMVEHGARVHEELASRAELDVHNPMNLRFPRFNRLLKTLTGFDISHIRADPILSKAAHQPWQGLDRYKTQDDSHTAEYARVNTLLECPELTLLYYCDAAGMVPDTPLVVPGLAGLESVDIGNGDLSPEWGVNVEIKGGSINYGPWTDRQRNALQAVFTPSSFFDSEETQKLMAGEARRHTSLKIFIEFSDNTKFRIPTREPSKDWQWDGQLRHRFAPSHVRHYGWLDAYMGGNSSINFALPMVAGPNGFDMLLEVHVDSLSVFCSLAPDAPIISSQYCRVSVQMPSPLKWADLRSWDIGIALTKTKIRMLREYANLFNDIIADMRPDADTQDLEHFVPMRYLINIALREYELSVYLNEHNVVTIPGVESDNTMLHLNGEHVQASVEVAADTHQPHMSQTRFAVNADPLTMGITVPLWNTHAAFRTPRTEHFGTVPQLSLDGTMVSYSAFHPDLVETLYLNIQTRGLVFKTLGWCIRYLINFKDNYFGDFTHRVTAQEFAQQRPRREGEVAGEKMHYKQVGDPVEDKYRPGMKNAYEVVLSVDVSDATLVAPDTLYDCRGGLMLHVPDAQIHLRLHDLFMEMSANFDPLTAVLSDDTERWLALGRMPSENEVKPHLLIDSIDIFGHRMFGPQPRGSTYLCNWEFALGKINMAAQPDDLMMMARVGQSVGLSVSDSDNALAPEFSVRGDPDANIYRVQIESVEVVIEGLEQHKLLLSVPDGVSVHTDDIPFDRFLSHVEVDVPTISVQALAATDALGTDWMSVASIDLDLLLTLGSTQTGWQDLRRQKLEYVREMDDATERCPFVYRSGDPAGISKHLGGLFSPSLPRRTDRTQAVDSMVKYSRPPVRGYLGNARSAESGAESDLSTMSPFVTPARSPHPHVQFSGSHQAYRRILGGVEVDTDASVRSRRDGPLVRRSDVSHLDATVKLPDAHARLGAAFSEVELPDLEGEQASFVRVDVRRGVFVRLTPLVANHLESILGALNTNYNVEHWLDSMHADYIAMRTVPDYKPRSTHMALLPSRISLTTFQDVLQAEEPSTPEASRRASYFSTVPTEILSQIEIEVEDPVVTMSMRSTRPPKLLQAIHDEHAYQKASITVDKVAIKLFHAEESASAFEKRRLPSDSLHTAPPSLDIRWSNIKSYARADGKLLKPMLDLGAIKIDFAESAAELVLGSGVAWQRAVEPLLVKVAERKEADAKRQRHLFYELSKYLESDPGQPVFLTRGSPLLDWTSTSLRFDRGWQALLNLRQGYLASPEHYDKVFREPTSRDQHEMLGDSEVLLASWRSWERQDDAVIESELLAQVFGAIGFNGPTSFSLPFGARHASFTVRLPLLDANLLDLSQAFNCAYVHGIIVTGSMRYTPANDEIAVAAKVEADDVSAQANPDLLALVRHILQVQTVFEQKREANYATQRRRASATALVPARLAQQKDFRPNLHISTSLLVRRMAVKAEAHGVMGQLELRNVRGFADSQLQDEHFGVSVFFGLEQLSVCVIDGVRAPGQPEPAFSEEQTLLTMTLSGPRSHLQVEDLHVARQYIGIAEKAVTAPKISVAIDSGHFSLRVLRNVLRMHKFFQDWSSQNLPKSRTVLDELKQDLSMARSPTKRRRAGSILIQPKSTRPRWQDITTVSLVLSIGGVAIELQATPSLRVDYRMSKAASFGHYRPAPPRSAQRRRSSAAAAHTMFEVGLDIEQQSIHFLPTRPHDQSVVPGSEETILLPAIRIAVANKERQLGVTAVLETVVVHLTAGIIDSILAAQKNFGEDIDELLDLINEKRVKRTERRASFSPVATSRASVPLWQAIKAQIVLQGFKVAIDSPSAVQNVHAKVVEVSVSQGKSESCFWQVKASDLALYLEQKTGTDGHTDRLAYFGIDLNANNRPRAVTNLPSAMAGSGMERSAEDPPLYLHIHLTRMHAVMQPATIDALGELVDHYTAEIQARRETRGQELKQMRTRVKQTLFAGDTVPVQPTTLIERLILTVHVDGLGVAIPLVEGGIDIPVELRKLHQRPAFLFAVPSIEFATRKGSAGYAQIVNLSLQFVPSFDQHNKRHYAAESHETTTSMILPQMSCTVQPRYTDRSVKHTRVDSSVTGLRLDLDPTIASYVFRLIDVFHLSQARFEKLATAENLEALGLAGSAAELTPSNSQPGSSAISRSTSAVQKAMTVQATFEFEYGEIHFHPRPTGHAKPKHKRTNTTSNAAGLHHRESASFGGGLFTSSPIAIVSPTIGLSSSTKASREPAFVLPALSVKAEYRDHHPNQVDGRSEMHVTAVLHGSKNTLYPNILPFFDDLATDVKTRLRRPTSAGSPVIPSPTEALDPAVPAAAAPVTPQSASRLQLTVSLRIDDSCLTFSCQPEAQVGLALEWKSGGFIFTMSPGSRSIGFIARIDEVGIDLQHVFAAGTGSRAVAAHLKGLVASVVLDRPVEEGEGGRRTLSVTVNAPSLVGDINMRQLHDALAFQRVWLDRIATMTPVEPVTLPPPTSRSKSSFAVRAPGEAGATLVNVLAAARIEAVSVTADMGMAIGTISARGENLVGRLRLVPVDSKSVSLSFDALQVKAEGRLKGEVRLTKSGFQTTLFDQTDEVVRQRNQLLGIALRLGDLHAALDYDFRRILLAESDPITVSVKDDWRHTASTGLKLAFEVVMGGFTLLATAQSVPITIGLIQEIERMLDEAEQKADQQVTHVASRKPNRNDTVTAIAAARAQQNRKASVDTLGSGSSLGQLRISGALKLEVDKLCLVVFPSFFSDTTVWRIDLINVGASLFRGLQDHDAVHRVLDLNMASATANKLTPKKHTAAEERDLDLAGWLKQLENRSATGEANIVKVPAIDVHMASWQMPGSMRVEHVYRLHWSSGLAITLNIGLLKETKNLVVEIMQRVTTAIAKRASARRGSLPPVAEPVSPKSALPKVAAPEHVPTADGHGEATAVALKTPAILAATTHAPPVLVYVEREPAKIDHPRLQTLGDATPPVMRSVMARAPAVTHSFVVSSLESLLLLLTETYEQQLSARGGEAYFATRP